MTVLLFQWVTASYTAAPSLLHNLADCLPNAFAFKCPRRIEPEHVRANYYADNTSANPGVIESGQSANVAAQPRLGILPKRWAGLGRGNSPGPVADGPAVNPDKSQIKVRIRPPQRFRSVVPAIRWSSFTQEDDMFMILFAVLLLAWLGGFLVFHVSGGLIHVLLFLAAISLVMHLFQRKTLA